MMKRFLSALLCACVLISMTGCAQDQEAPEDLLYSSAPIQFNSDSSSEEESSPEPEESQADKWLLDTFSGLSPLVCRLAPEEQAALLARLPLLEEFGFDLEDFGGGALIVRQAPFDVDVGDIEGTLTEIAQKLLATGSADPAAARDELLHTMACKAAIKGGWKTSPQELERVARAVMSGQVKYCPHGRPVAVELTKKQLEKQFKRIV